METKRRFFVVLDNKETQRKEIKEFAFRSLVIRLDIDMTCHKIERFALAWLRGAIAGVGPVSWYKHSGNQELTGRKGTYAPFTIDRLFSSEEDAIDYIQTGSRKLSIGNAALYDDGTSTIDVSPLSEDIRQDLIKALPKTARLINLTKGAKVMEHGGLYDTFEDCTGEECMRHKKVGMATYLWDGGKAVSKQIKTDITDVPQEELECINFDKRYEGGLFYDVISGRYLIDYSGWENTGYRYDYECEEDNQISIEYFD